MILSHRIKALSRLGKVIGKLSENEIESIARRAHNINNWFTAGNVKQALEGCAHMLQEDKLKKWTNAYNLSPDTPKKVGVVMAGNIPLVGFHDFLSVLISGHILYAKLSSQDPFLLPYLAEKLVEIEPEFSDYIEYPQFLKEVDAVIATGSDNTSRYFEYYFSSIPHVIRKNRSSVLVLSGNETEEELKETGKDIFSYYGLGCRNISKVFVPEGYTFDNLYEALEEYVSISDHHKYVNNYDYNKSIYLVNKVPHLDNGFLLIRESEEFVSPISVLYYERYKNEEDLKDLLSRYSEKIQCTVSTHEGVENRVMPGNAQKPEPWDYADGVNTLEFLSTLP